MGGCFDLKFEVRVVETIVLESGEIMVVHSNPPKTRGFAPQIPEIGEHDENGGYHSGKITVCQKHCFDNPDDGAGSNPRRSEGGKGPAGFRGYGGQCFFRG